MSLAANPTNKDRVYVGGINLFSSNQGGKSWGQLTHSRGRYAQYTHADQHSVIFNKNNPLRMLVGNDGGVAFSATGGSVENRNNKFHTAQYYSLAVAPVGMFDNYKTIINGYDPDQGSWDQSANDGQGAYRYKLQTVIDGHSDVFAGGMQDQGTSIQADNNNGFSIGNDFGSGDGAATMFSQNNENKYVVYNYVYNNRIRVLNMNNPNNNDYSYRYTISDNEDDEGDFINKAALDSNLGIIYANAGNGNIRAYYNWDNFGNQNSIKDNYVIGGLSSSATAITVSPFQTQTSTLFVGTENGQLWKISDAQKTSNQTKELISGNDLSLIHI